MDKWNNKFQYFDCIFNTIQSSLNYISVANGPKCVYVCIFVYQLRQNQQSGLVSN